MNRLRGGGSKPASGLQVLFAIKSEKEALRLVLPVVPGSSNLVEFDRVW